MKISKHGSNYLEASLVFITLSFCIRVSYLRTNWETNRSRHDMRASFLCDETARSSRASPWRPVLRLLTGWRVGDRVAVGHQIE